MNIAISIRPIALLVALIVELTVCTASAESLQQTWDAALAADRGLKASRENTAANAELLEAARSARLPNVVIEAGRTVLDNTPTLRADLLGQSLQMPVAQRISTAYKAMATLPLYTGGRIERGIDAAALMLEAAKLSESGDEQSLKLRTADAYVNVLRAGRMLKVAESHVQSLEAHARDVENLHEQGMVVKSDRLSIWVALADARQKALQASNATDLTRAAFNRLLGRPLEQALTLDELAPQNGNLPLTTLTERALAQRAELAVMSRQVEAMRHQTAAMRGENRLQIALSGGYGYQENRYQVHEGQWMVTLGMKWNLFDGGALAHRAGAVERQAAALTEQRDDLASVVTLQVRQAWLDVEETRKRLQVTESAITQAEENLRVVRDRYASGHSTNTEVLDAETLRATSEANHAAAFYDAALAGLRLKRVTGEL